MTVFQRSPWSASSPPAQPRPSLAFNLRVNVAVIGGGITGITAAYLLKQAGKTVALLERDACGSGETGRSTGHVTAVTDRSLTALVDQVGFRNAQAVWDAGFAAVARVRGIVRDERINCDFCWVRGLLHAGAQDDAGRARDELRREADIARALGIDARFVDAAASPAGEGVLFENQARLHPRHYLDVLADRIDGDGSYVFERTHVDAIDGDGPIVVRSGPYRVTADAVVVATQGAGLYSASEDFTLSDRLHPRATFAVSGVVARGLLPEGLYWEWTDGPYEYLRVDRGDEQDQVVLGGLDRPVSSTEDAEAAILAALERRCEERLPGVRVSQRWTGRVLETEDGLPYIGEYSRNRFIATGFSGNGLTFGTLGGIMTADAFTGRDNPWREVFDPRRVVRAGAGEHRGVEATGLSRAVCGLSG